MLACCVLSFCMVSTSCRVSFLLEAIEVDPHDGRGADFDFNHNHHRRVLARLHRRFLAKGIDTSLLTVGNMWYKVEGKTEKCTCGGVAEKWVLLGRVKVLNQTYICSTCHPQFADYVNRLMQVVRQGSFRSDHHIWDFHFASAKRGEEGLNHPGVEILPRTF